MGNLSMPAKLKAWSLELQQFQLLEEEIKFLHRLYCGREAHGHPNPVTTAMLVKHLGVKDSKIIAYQIFAVYDVGGAGVVTFPEFVMALWDFCMEPQESLIHFVFDLYDEGSYGSLPLSVLKRVLQDINGGSKANIEATMQCAFQELNDVADQHQIITRNLFHSVVGNHPALLYPVCRLQVGLRHKVFGKSFWDKQMLPMAEQSVKSSRSDRYRARSALASAALADEKYINMQWFNSRTSLKSAKRTYSSVQSHPPLRLLALTPATEVEDLGNASNSPPPISIPPDNCTLKPKTSSFKSGKYLSPFTLHNLTKSGKIKGCRDTQAVSCSDYAEHTDSWTYS